MRAWAIVVTVLGITATLCLAASPLAYPVLPRMLPAHPVVSAIAFGVAVLTAVAGIALLVGARRRATARADRRVRTTVGSSARPGPQRRGSQRQGPQPQGRARPVADGGADGPDAWPPRWVPEGYRPSTPSGPFAAPGVPSPRPAPEPSPARGDDDGGWIPAREPGVAWALTPDDDEPERQWTPIPDLSRGTGRHAAPEVGSHPVSPAAPQPREEESSPWTVADDYAYVDATTLDETAVDQLVVDESVVDEWAPVDGWVPTPLHASRGRSRATRPGQPPQGPSTTGQSSIGTFQIHAQHGTRSPAVSASTRTRR